MDIELLIWIAAWLFIGWITPFIVDYFKKWKGGID